MKRIRLNLLFSRKFIKNFINYSLYVAGYGIKFNTKKYIHKVDIPIFNFSLIPHTYLKNYKIICNYDELSAKYLFFI